MPPPARAAAADSPESSPSTLSSPSARTSGPDPTASRPEPSPLPDLDAPGPGQLGKIARLPKSIREDLNRRLLNGETGPKLLDWLNHEPQVQSVLRDLFAGRPINQPNLSHWRTGGFRDWLAHQELLRRVQALTESTQELSPSAARALTEQISIKFVAASLLDLPAYLQLDTHPPSEFRRLEQIVALLTHLRRSDHQAAKFHLERERLALIKRRVRHDTHIEKGKHRREVTLADYRKVFGIPDPEDEPAPSAPSKQPHPTPALPATGSSEDAPEAESQDEQGGA